MTIDTKLYLSPALIDAKVAAAEARPDAKFERLARRLDSIDGKLTRIETESVRTRTTVRTTAFSRFAAIVTVLGLVFAAFAQSFNMGAKVSDVAREQAQRIVDAQPRPASEGPAAPTRR